MNLHQHNLIAQLREEIKKNASSIPFVKSIYVIGSLSEGNFNKNSDIDLLINFSEFSTNDFYLIEKRLNKLTGRKIQIVIKNKCNPLFITLNPNKKLIYVNSKHTKNTIKRREATSVY